MIQESGLIPLRDIGTIAMVKQGKIRVLPAVQQILPDSVRFADGSTHPFEGIIFATGHTPGFGRLIEGFDTIADARGRPHRFGAETGIAGLNLAGFKNTATDALCEIAREAPRGGTRSAHCHRRGRTCLRFSCTLGRADGWRRQLLTSPYGLNRHTPRSPSGPMALRIGERSSGPANATQGEKT